MKLGIFAFLAWCGFLWLEARRLRSWRNAIPLVVSVTGTRGKSTLVRLLHAVLQASGRSVLAKTTGSKALFLLPDGREKPLRRRGIPTILEQIRLLRRGAALGVDVVVAEVMSIHAENHGVESRRILSPNMLVVTNLRPDHTEATGGSREEVAELHLLDVGPGARVFIPQEESLPAFRAGVAAVGGTLEEVPGGVREGAAFLAEVRELVWAVCRALDIPDPVIQEGIDSAEADPGALWVGRYQEEGWEEGAFTASAFAANDPASTGLALREAISLLPPGPGAGSSGKARPVIGVLSLRKDRGDRTLQWVETLEAGAFPEFQSLFLAGFHGPAVRARLTRNGWEGRVHLMRDQDPVRATRTILDEARGREPLLFGFGNFKGVGEALATHWRSAGTQLEGGEDGI